MDQLGEEHLTQSWLQTDRQAQEPAIVSGVRDLDEAGAEIRQCYLYWRELRERRGALPCRSDIRPSRIPKLLSRFVLVELAPRGAFDPMYRLAGTAFEQVAGRSLTGIYFRDLYDPEAFAVATRIFEAVAGDGRPRYMQSLVCIPDRSFYRVKRIFLPWSKDGRLVDHIGGMAIELDLR